MVIWKNHAFRIALYIYCHLGFQERLILWADLFWGFGVSYPYRKKNQRSANKPSQGKPPTAHPPTLQKSISLPKKKKHIPPTYHPTYNYRPHPDPDPDHPAVCVVAVKVSLQPARHRGRHLGSTHLGRGIWVWLAVEAEKILGFRGPEGPEEVGGVGSDSGVSCWDMQGDYTRYKWGYLMLSPLKV